MGMADNYQKPVIIGSELPFVGGDLESQMAYMLGKKGYICYPGPEDAAVVMASLASYGQYLGSRT